MCAWEFNDPVAEQTWSDCDSFNRFELGTKQEVQKVAIFMVCVCFFLLFCVSMYMGVGSNEEGSWCVRRCLFLLSLSSGWLVLVWFFVV